MKLILKIKLLPTQAQEGSLINTIKTANDACNAISNTAWDKHIFNQFKLHHECYYDIKEKYNLSAQMIVRCISKVTDSYKLDKKTKRTFKPFGAITYDSRIMSYTNKGISLWTVDGRQTFQFVCHNTNYLPYIKGEADLIYKKDKFFLFQTVEIPDEDITDVEEFIGFDFGQIDIVHSSEGKVYQAEWLNKYREKQQKIRSSIQSKGTKGKTHSMKRGCAKLLKRLKGRERTTATIINHTISKNIVLDCKAKGKGIAIEDLTNIRKTTTKQARQKCKTNRIRMGRWSYGQLRSFLEYKAKREGVKMVVVEPAYTSKTCSCCHHIGNRNGKLFVCENCGARFDADYNAARNIALLGVAINTPEKSTMYCNLLRA